MAGKKGPGIGLVAVSFISAAAYAVYLFVFGPYRRLVAATGGEGLPESNFGFTGGDLYAFLGSFGNSDEFLSAYAMFQGFDAVNAVLTSIAFALGIWALSARLFRSSIPRLLVLLPLAMGAFDLLENVLIVSVIRNLPLRYFGIAEGAGTATLLKMLSGLLVFSSFIALLVFAAIRRLKKRKNES